MTNKKAHSYYQSNTGLGYGELNYFVRLSANQFLCIGHTLHENDACIELGEIVHTTHKWEDTSNEKINYIMKDEIVSCNAPEIQINTKLIDLIIQQNATIDELNKKNQIFESQIQLIK